MKLMLVQKSLNRMRIIRTHKDTPTNVLHCQRVQYTTIKMSDNHNMTPEPMKFYFTFRVPLGTKTGELTDQYLESPFSLEQVIEVGAVNDLMDAVNAEVLGLANDAEFLKALEELSKSGGNIEPGIGETADDPITLEEDSSDEMRQTDEPEVGGTAGNPITLEDDSADEMPEQHSQFER